MNAAQNPEVQRLIAQLADIRGLDRIGWWPLAPGWWAMLAMVGILVLAAMGLAARNRRHARSWQHQATVTLAALADQLDAVNAREILLKCSDLLRRIAMQIHSRAECAGLEGEEWTRWLTKNDPGGFDWNRHAQLLTEAAYAPPEIMPSPQQVRPLINAAGKWVR